MYTQCRVSRKFSHVEKFLDNFFHCSDIFLLLLFASKSLLLIICPLRLRLPISFPLQISFTHHLPSLSSSWLFSQITIQNSFSKLLFSTSCLQQLQDLSHLKMAHLSRTLQNRSFLMDRSGSVPVTL